MRIIPLVALLFTSLLFSVTALADPVHAVFILHEREYNTPETVPAFADKELAEGLGWKCTYVFGDGVHSISGLDVLEDADLMFVSVRRRFLPPEQLAHIKRYVESGKPVVGIRTASHAFAARGRVPEGHVEWKEFDADVLGGNYTGHHSNHPPDDPKTTVWAVDSAKNHPILEGIPKEPFKSTSWLYKTAPLADSATLLLTGRVEDSKPEPVAWTNESKYGNRVFYTSLGHPDDFADPIFRRLLVNGMFWALGKEPPADSPAEDGADR